MAIYVYISEQCRKEISQQNYVNEIDSFRRKVEATQSLEVFDRFPPPYLKKRFERQIRLVARDFLVDEHVVVVFLRLLVRGGKEYKQFGDTSYRVLPGYEAISTELEEQKLRNYVGTRQESPPPRPPVPTEEEGLFLHSALKTTENIYAEAHCCETKLWVETIISPEFKNWKNYFIPAVLNTCDHDELGLQELRCEQDPTFGILFRRLPERRMVILFTPFKGDAPKQLVWNRYAELLSDESPDQESVLRKTKRAYPHELVLNQDAWMSVQDDSDGNMALSLEEVEVLEAARTYTGGFPLFINGSAGSGKSTILQYLFAEYLYHHFNTNKETAGPVLFACNDELLARSQTSIRTILRARFHRSEMPIGVEEWLKEHEQDLSSSLRNFHEWLLRLTPVARFPREKQVDYARFRLWWEERFKADSGARKLYDADISWHVIRTYIKGISMDDSLEPEDYLEIPTKQKSVTLDSYRLVYENVWKRYKEDQKLKGLWDHQDLARYVLENELIQSAFPAVFCDEAQDFTRLELEVLHRCCLFNARTLTSFQLPQVPIAFAGDPFQTLNPTGFRWEATKAFFTDKFIENYPGQKKREINYQELRYNYRSSHHIVRFINSLQLARSVIFNFPEIKPQHPWEEDENVPRVVFFERNSETLSELKKQSEIRIIVPCEAGYEGQWAKDNGLADYVQFDEAGVPKNVVSPVGVKGLEFPRVVLFGFGAACPNVLRIILTQLNEGRQVSPTAINEDQAIEPQYFWNRLYVAASRPRKRLFIIDDASDFQSFWNPIFSNSDNIQLRAADVSRWEDELGQLIHGDESAWEGDQEDPLETAKRLEEEGNLRKDRTMLRQAALSFRDAKRFSDEKRCKAKALEFELNYLEAAKLWKDLGRPEQALVAAWNARSNGLNFVIDLGDAEPKIKNDPKWKIADFLHRNGSLSDGVALFSDVIDSLSVPKFQEEILMSESWPEMILLSIKCLLKRTDEDTGRWSIAYRHIEKIFKQGVKLPQAELGDLAYRGGLMGQAHDHWSQVGIDDRIVYESRFLQAKASVLPYPQNLEVYGDILRRTSDKNIGSKVLELVRIEGTEKLSNVQFEVFILANLLTENLSKALESVRMVQDFSLLNAIWDSAMRAGENTKTRCVVARIGELLCESDEWQDFTDFLVKGTFKQLPISGLSGSVRHSPLNHSIPLVAILAECADFEHASNDLKTRVGDVVIARFAANLAWKHDIHPLVVGRALERAGLFRQILPFYESVANHRDISKELKRWAWGRWARVKNQQVALQGNRRGLDEAKEKAATYGFGTPEQVPDELPSPLPPVDEIVEKTSVEPSHQLTQIESKSEKNEDLDRYSELPQQERIKKVNYGRILPLNGFEIRVMPDGKRVNLTHGATGQVLSIFPLEGKALLDGDLVQTSDEKLVSLPDHWGFEVNLAQLKRGKVVLTADDGFEISLPVIEL